MAARPKENEDYKVACENVAPPTTIYQLLTVSITV